MVVALCVRIIIIARLANVHGRAAGNRDRQPVVARYADVAEALPGAAVNFDAVGGGARCIEVVRRAKFARVVLKQKPRAFQRRQVAPIRALGFCAKRDYGGCRRQRVSWATSHVKYMCISFAALITVMPPHAITSSWHAPKKFEFHVDHRNAVLHQTAGTIPLTNAPYMFMGDVAISCHRANFSTLFHIFNNARLAVAVYNKAAQNGINDNAEAWDNASKAFAGLVPCSVETPPSDLVTFIDDRDNIACAARACALYAPPDASKSVDTLESVLAHLAKAGKYKELCEDAIRDQKYSLLANRALASALTFEAACATEPSAENATGYVENGAAAVSFYQQITPKTATGLDIAGTIQTVESNLNEFHGDAYREWKQRMQQSP